MTEKRRRKLVDRTNVYHTYSPPARSSEELCYLDELPGTDAGRSCFVAPSSPPASPSPDPSSPRFRDSLPFSMRLPQQALDLVLRYLPIIMPLVAYATYESTAKAFDTVVEAISGNSWVAVDGGQYQATIITPAINGLVVPSIALLFATLTSTTINTLRQRQLQIATSLNTEANDLRMLSTMIDSLPPELRRTKNHLREYLVVSPNSAPCTTWQRVKTSCLDAASCKASDQRVRGFLHKVMSSGRHYRRHNVQRSEAV